MSDHLGIVLQVQDYKENDGLITLLCEESKITFLAKGIMKSTSKNRCLCQPFSLVHVTLHDSHRLPILMHGKVTQYFYKIQEDLCAQSVFFVLRDCLLKVRSSIALYQAFLQTLQAFQNEDSDAYTRACLCLKLILEQEGIAPYTQGCVLCKKTSDLETISLQDGGFLCRHCNHFSHRSFAKEDLVGIYSLFKIRQDQFDEFTNLYQLTIDDFIYWANWFAYYEQISLSSITFLESVR